MTAGMSDFGRACSRIRGLFVVVIAFVAATVPALSSATLAHAAQTRPQMSTFNGSGTNAGAFGSLQRIAIHQSSGTVYAIDAGSMVVDKFDAAGVAQNFTALSSSSLGGGAVTGPDGPVTFDLGSDSDLAVDNSAAATNGRLYVLQEYGANAATVFAFDADGTYLHKMSPAGADACGVAVDSAGNVWIGDYNSSSVIEYDAAGSPTGNVIDTSGEGPPCHIAFDSGDNLYVALFSGGLDKYSPTGSLLGQIDPDGTSAVAVDPTTNHVFAVHVDGVKEYDSAGAPVLDFGQIELSAPVGVAARGDNVYVSDSGGNSVHRFGSSVQLADVTTGDAGDIAARSATLNGVVNPQGVAVTDCQFEYTVETDFQSNGFANALDAPCAPDPGAGSSNVAVSAQVTGLSTETNYDVRLVVTSANGTNSGSAHSFATGPPQQPPTVATGAVDPGATGDIRLFQGTVNPNGSSLISCRFEYGRTTDYGAIVPCSPSAAAVGQGAAAVSVSGSTEPLDPSATYHYRLVATNSLLTGQGEDRTFTTGPSTAPDDCPDAAIRAEQGINALRLPGCMALELASPAEKFNEGATVPGVSASGDRIRFLSVAALGDTPYVSSNITGDYYVASRGAQGWTTASTSPPAQFNGGNAVVSSFTPDFARWLYPTLQTGRQTARAIAQAYTGGLGEAAQALSPLLVPQNSEFEVSSSARFQGASSDNSHIYLQPVTVAQATGQFYLPGDPSPAGPGAELNTYVAYASGDPSLELLARDGAGTVWGGSCGARLGGMRGVLGSRNQGAVSADGSRAYFSARPTQPAVGSCDTASNRLRILRRVETPSGPSIAPLVSGAFGDCARTVDLPVVPACGSSGPAGTTLLDGDDLYQGGSVDGTKVYFTTTRQLADSDVDGGTACSEDLGASSGCDLYLYDTTKPSGQRLTQVSAGDDGTPGDGANVLNAITAVSGDGSRVYFAAQGVLTTDPSPEGAVATVGQPNLYTWDATTRHLDFIGTLSSADSGSLWGGSSQTFKNGAYPVPATGQRNGIEVGGDGHTLLFDSAASLTSDDHDGGFRDIYRYDATARRLDRVSKAAPGGDDDAGFNADIFNHEVTALGADFAEQNRWVSESGKVVSFMTSVPLVADDRNGVTDAYVSYDGRMIRLPGTAARGQDTPDATSSVMSHDGSTIAFQSRLSLLPQDGDTSSDIYVARIDGGYEISPPAVPCDPLADTCQGAGADPTPTAVQTQGGGGINALVAGAATLELGKVSAAQRKALAASGRVTLTVKVTTAGTVRAVASALLGKRPRTVGSASRVAVGAGTVKLPLALSKAARRELSTEGKLSVKIAVTHSQVRVARTVTLKLTRVKPKAKSKKKANAKKTATRTNMRATKKRWTAASRGARSS